MSTDWAAVCDPCRAAIHLGQSGLAHASLGYGSKDVEGCAVLARWIHEHLRHGHVRIIYSDDLHESYSYETELEKEENKDASRD